MTKIEFVYSETKRIPKSNYVTSPHVFVQGRNARNKKDRDLDMDGLYSPRIFGRFGVCQCGITTKINKVCTNCGYRVISSRTKSQFAYQTICKVVRFGAEISMVFSISEQRSIQFSKHILDIASYQMAILISSTGLEVLPVQEAIDKSEEDSQLLFGNDALREILSPEEFEKWELSEDKVMTDSVLISHPVTRPYTITGAGKIILPNSTDALTRLIARDIRARKDIEFMAEIQDELITVLSYMAINQALQTYYDAVYEVFASTPKSVRKSHVIAANSSSIGRYVLVNNPHLDPTEIAVPMSFVRANYRLPEEMTYEEINEMLSHETVLLNRPPTVSNLSMMTLTPQLGYDCVVGINPAIAPGFNADFDGDQVIILPIRNSSPKKMDYWNQRRELVTGGWKNGLLKRQVEFIMGDVDFQREINLPAEVTTTEDLNNWFNELEDEVHLETLRMINLNLHRAAGISLNDFHIEDKKVVSDSPLLKPGQDQALFNAEFDQAMVTDFRNGVITSKVGITESGYFYKKAVAAGEYFRFAPKNCNAEPQKFLIKDHTEFKQRIQSHYGPDGAIEWTGPGEYEAFTVLGCEYTMEISDEPAERNHPKVRTVCKKCFGFVDSEGISSSPYIGVNTGIILSEIISQETLNAINTGEGDMSVLKILENKFVGTRQEVIDFIESSYQQFIASTGILEFEDRWIQVQFLSTTHQVHYKRKKLEHPLFEVMSKISSMKMSDPLTHWIQSPQLNLFTQMIGQEFESSSLKSWVMLNKKG